MNMENNHKINVHDYKSICWTFQYNKPPPPPVKEKSQA